MTQNQAVAVASPDPTSNSGKSKARHFYQMQVTEIIDHTPWIRELVLQTEKPAEFSFRAGQFVMLHVPAEPKALLRAYSIASTDQVKNGFRLIFKAVENGAATKFIWALKGHEVLQFTGPFGRVFFKDPPTKQIIMLNTGSGISQHYSYLVSFAKKYPDLRYRLLFGLREEADIYYRAELETLKAELTDFQYDFVLSRPSPSWTGKTGYIQNHITDFDYHTLPTTFYLCGNGAMIKDVKKRLLEDERFPAAQLLAEAFD